MPIKKLKYLFSFFLLALTTSACADHLSVSKETTLNASPETVWKMIGDFNHLDVWHPVVADSQLTGDTTGVGAVRVLTLGNGATITEKLLSHSDADCNYSYAITESPLPISGYTSKISVTSAADGKSTVKWSSTFDARDATDEEAIGAIAGIYDAGLSNLEKHFNQ
jgi:mxaD protein